MSGRLKSLAGTSSQYVDLSRWGFAIWWTVLLVVHLLTGGYNAAFALFYHELRHTYLYMCLDYSGIGMPAENHEVISLVNAVMTAIHGGFVLLMIGGSIWRRELVFSPWDTDKDQVYKTSKLNSADKAAGLKSKAALEVPDTISDFHITTGIKVYNSTINEWGESAAITNTNHPALIWFYFVRVHVKDGVLPEGVLSVDFPGNLYDLEFTYVNYQTI
ncbi:hypothetical protein PI125_g12962 [Phytophthora idaei]|nr:hypothetical protein PI125_g12962 [Phytophthora idaei]KAG3154037.1 hypothetical protein PI126_g9810 [Phytophthora idaei]